MPAALAALAAAPATTSATLETFRIDFVTDLSGDPIAGSPTQYAANRDHVFDGHYTVNGSTAIFASTAGSIVNFAAFFDDDTIGGVGNDVVGDGAPRAATGISVSFLHRQPVLRPERSRATKL